MIFHFAVLNVIWICTAILFNGLFFYVGILPGTPFANTYYTTIADTIAYVSIWASYLTMMTRVEQGRLLALRL